MRWKNKYFLIGRGLMAPADDSGAEGSSTAEESSGGPTQSPGESDASPAVEGSAPESTPAGQEAPEATPAQPEGRAWYYNRIDTLTRKLRETQAERDALRRRSEETLSQAEGQAPSPAPAHSDDAEIQRRAAALVEMQEFNRRANEVWDTGRRESQTFEQGVHMLQQMAGGELPMAFISATLELDAPAKVLDALAKNPDLAYQIVNETNPVKQTAALAKFERGLVVTKPKAQVSSAPPPVAPRAGTPTAAATRTEYDTDMPIGEWMAMRNKR